MDIIDATINAVAKQIAQGSLSGDPVLIKDAQDRFDQHVRQMERVGDLKGREEFERLVVQWVCELM